MAIYRCEVKNISRGQGRSCVAAAAYRHAERLHDDRQQMTHAYECKQGVEHSEIVVPDTAPDWARNRESLWNAADLAEKRKDARTAKEIIVSLPRELTREQQVEAVRKFCREEFAEKGLVADFAIHEPDAQDGLKQPHAHIMTTTRAIEAEGFAKGKDKSLDQPMGVEELREKWAVHCNKALERAHCPERVDHRSLEAQRAEALMVANDNARPLHDRETAQIRVFVLERAPEPKIGPVAMQMRREGRGGGAHALRDALEARQDRAMRQRLVERWRDVGREIAAKARDMAEKAHDKWGSLDLSSAAKAVTRAAWAGLSLDAGAAAEKTPEAGYQRSLAAFDRSSRDIGALQREGLAVPPSMANAHRQNFDQVRQNLRTWLHAEPERAWTAAGKLAERMAQGGKELKHELAQELGKDKARMLQLARTAPDMAREITRTLQLARGIGGPRIGGRG